MGKVEHGISVEDGFADVGVALVRPTGEAMEDIE
jgi:hypothetical protein